MERDRNTNNNLTAARFIERWSDLGGGQERSNYSLFLSELCDLIGVKRPDPARAAYELNDYVFERRVERRCPDGSTETGRIDLYKRGCFILEAKQSRQRGRKNALAQGQGDLFSRPSHDLEQQNEAIDYVMIQARRQAERYAKSLPAEHEYPPFIIACDVGRALELYADFSGHGRHYSQFPDARGSRIELEELVDPKKQELLRSVWEAPSALDPALQAAKVTREIAGHLAEISKALEARGFETRSVAVFLMRCLFTMFVEDVGLLRKKGFADLLTKCLEAPSRFTFEIDDLWRHMDRGSYSPGIGERLLRFNGKLFKNASALPLTQNEIRLLRDASDADWRDLEPAIFGTLFEQALDPEDRRRLGAHYTPRAYVERVVNATIIEPLTKDWIGFQSAAERELRSGAKAAAIREIEDFLRHLSSVRVLDPACGTGNFLYVALKLMKQLEGEAVQQLRDIAGDETVSRVNDISIKPEQFFGMELNNRAVEIAELVLWIGYIQWHLRTRAEVPPEPVLGNSDHVQYKDALIRWEGYPEPQLRRDKLGRPIQSQQWQDLYAFPNPVRTEWPEADFIVGNPPFVGGKDIRGRLGTGYAEALRSAHPWINSSADLVMYWWDHAADLLARKGTRLRRFGLVTTNSITQVFQRRVMERHLDELSSISLLLAIGDHPWTKASKDAAAVRIGITVAGAGMHDGISRRVSLEAGLDTDEPTIEFISQTGRINADLTIGVDVTKALALQANNALCSPGVKLHGDGFVITRNEAAALGMGRRFGLDKYIKEYRNGRDLASRSRDALVIDLFGIGVEEVRHRFPEVYQHLLQTVRQQRASTFAKSATRDAQEYLRHWWQFGKPRSELRPALEGLPRYIATVETMKHRIFQFMDIAILPDNMLVAIASDDGFHLGVLSSKVHSLWASKAGGTLEDRPRYTKSRCFDPFVFPDAPASSRSEIAALAEELDETRKLVLTENPDLTLTKLYNTLEACKAGKLISPSDKAIMGRGRTLILEELHDNIDRAVLQAYGWTTDLTDEQIIEKLVDLNMSRSSDERRGLIRWLRPDYQIDKIGPLAHRADRVQSILGTKVKAKASFPIKGRDQAAVVLDLIGHTKSPMTIEDIAESFAKSDQTATKIKEVLRSLAVLGQAETYDNGRTYLISAV